MTTTPKKTQEIDPRRRLLRSLDERMFAGVAGGLGKYLDVDPTFVRLGFAAATLFGGLGLLAYLVMAVVVPQDDGSGNPVEGRPSTWMIVLLAIAALVILPGPFIGFGDGPWFLGFGLFWLVALVVVGALAYRAWRGEWPGQGGSEGRTRPERGKKTGSSPATAATTEMRTRGDGTGQRVVRLLAIGLLALCAFWLAVAVAGVGAFAAATGNGEIVAGVVIALGIALAGMALVGEGLRRTAPWLIGLALLLALPAGAVAAADVRFDGGIGEQTYTPVTAAEIPDDGYELGVGQLKIDLRQMDIGRGETVRLPAELGLGQMIVSVPSGVCVTGEAEAKGGELLVRGVSNSGANAEFERGAAPGSDLPTVEVDAELQFGQLVVTDREPEFDERGPGHSDENELAPMPEACLG
jgi:phage shock protein PspC (stress-responsive transcriptional regulator)